MLYSEAKKGTKESGKVLSRVVLFRAIKVSQYLVMIVVRHGSASLDKYMQKYHPESTVIGVIQQRAASTVAFP